MQSGDYKALIQSVLNNDIETTRHYLSMGLNPNFCHPEIMTTPLIEAVRTQNISMIQLLMEYDADPQVVSQMGESALSLAKRDKNQKLISLLSNKKRSPFSFHQLFKKFN